MSARENPPAPAPREDGRRLAISLAIAFLAVGLAYFAIAVPATWFPSQSPLAWSASQLSLVRGTGSVVGDELVVTGSAPDGSVLVSIETDFRTDQYPAVAWAAIDLPEGASVRLLWRNDVAPTRLNSVAIAVESGRPLPVALEGSAAWIGRAKGIALLVATRLDRPLRIRGVVAKPMGMVEVARDRASEWLAFEPWTGESVNKIVGGADLQDLPLPALVAAIVIIAVALWYAWTRAVRRSLRALPFAAVAAFIAGWFVLDARYMFNLSRQVADTSARYRGLALREKHLAAEDGALFGFIENARAVLPATPARIFVGADAHYFRGRAAYHLYPHNVFYDPVRNAMPRPEVLRPGDYMLIYQRHGTQYDVATKRLRWDGNAPVSAALEASDTGASLFRIE